MKNSNVYLNILLEEREALFKQYKKELNGMPPGYLARRKCKNGYTYMQILQDSGKKKRIGINKNEYLIARLARKKYLQLSIKELDREISKLQSFLNGYHTFDAGEIVESMPPAYKELPEEVFFPALKSAKDWATDEYEKNTYKPEEKIHITNRGLRVRSKSELIIAEKLDSYKIPYRYEQMIGIGGHSFSPDFTINSGRELIYWEHCGMMSSPYYKGRNKWKLGRYEEAGIVPWANLIITYDMEDGGINSGVIESEIVNRLLHVMYR